MSVSISDIFLIHAENIRTINLTPFQSSLFSDLINNVLIFIPFGTLLAISAKKSSFWQKMAWVTGFSLTIEIIQILLSLGRSDISDIIMNTTGGMISIIIYALLQLLFPVEKLDRRLTDTGIIVFIVVFAFTVFIILGR